MEQKDCVAINAFDANGKLIFSQTIGNYEWYEELHPIIDSAEERVRLGVVRIEGKQYDNHGEITVEWHNNYTESGKIVEAWEWRGDLPVQHTHF